MTGAPSVLTCPKKMQAWAKQLRAAGKRIALVPTMGCLHAGHDALVQHARAAADVTVVSIFVNPAQFAPQEDLASYPRNLDADLQRLAGLGADVVFAPDIVAMYPDGFDHYVTPGNLARQLCGKSRPSHFRGVCTVVAMLLRITGCQVAVFGRKDYQQWRIVERMVQDLWLDVKIVGVPTVRDTDGLAQSSRNRYLGAEQRLAALMLPKALDQVARAVAAGERDCAEILHHARQSIAGIPTLCWDYIDIVDAKTLQPQPTVGVQALCAAAMMVGDTRLIDNRELF